MVKKLITRKKFSEMAGTSQANVTKLCKNGLKSAVVGSKIDLNHPDVVSYLEKRDQTTTPEPVLGVDSRYEEAIEICRQADKWNVRTIQTGLGVGNPRAKKIFAMIEAAGIENLKTEGPPPPPKDYNRGHVAKARAKKASVTNEDMILDIPENIEEFADMTLRELIYRFGTDERFKDWLDATKKIEDINEKRLKNAVAEGKLVARDLVKIGVIDPLDAAHTKLLTDGAKTITRRAVAMSGAGKSIDEIEKFVKDQITSFIRPVKAKVARALKNA